MTNGTTAPRPERDVAAVVLSALRAEGIPARIDGDPKGAVHRYVVADLGDDIAADIAALDGTELPGLPPSRYSGIAACRYRRGDRGDYYDIFEIGGETGLEAGAAALAAALREAAGAPL